MTESTRGDAGAGAPRPGQRDLVIGGTDIREVGNCLCLRLRRSARQLTQFYEARLAPSGLTVGQFGILAQVYGAEISRPGVSLKALAQRLGMDPTTLNRALKPLAAAGHVRIAPDPANWRAKLVSLTPDGETKLAAAVPLWRAANDATTDGLGAETARALGGLLDLASRTLAPNEPGITPGAHGSHPGKILAPGAPRR